MSMQHKQWLHHWETVLNNLRRASYMHGGLPLSQRDKETWIHAITLLAILVCDLSLSCSGNLSNVLRWLYYISKLDVRTVVKCFKAINSALARHVSDVQRKIDFSCFKHSIAFDDALVVQNIVAPFKRDIVMFLDYGRTDSFANLRQVFSFIERLTLLDISDEETVIDFINRDEGLHMGAHWMYKELNSIARQWLDAFSVTGLPSHSGGSTADAGRSLLGKYMHLSSDSLLDYVLKKHGYCSDDYKIVECTFVRQSKLTVVPKSATSRRIICMESATLQFYQHLVQRDLYRFFQTNSCLRDHIHIYDQSYNRRMCILGSLTGEYATLDLSAASDYVSWPMVKSVFAGTPLLPWLYATRSRCVQYPDGTSRRLNKFAPMGSALCFPVMCLIFALVCEYVKRNNWMIRGELEYLVYGDDIVCNNALTNDIVTCLQSLGFVVNVDKSFIDSRPFTFRESCGTEAIGGIDVTPIRLSRHYSGVDVEMSPLPQVPILVELANAFYQKGYFGCRNWIIQSLLKLPHDLQPLFGDSPGRITSLTSDENYQHSSRYNKRYQRSEVRGGQIVTPLPPIPGEDACLSSSELTDSDLLIEQARYIEYWLHALARVERDNSSTFRQTWNQIVAEMQRNDPTVGRIRVGDPTQPRLVTRWQSRRPMLNGVASLNRVSIT